VSSIAGSNVVFKTYGVKLDITPRVGANGVIRAVVHTEVSGIDPSVTTPAGPALLERTIDTEFNIHGGETIVLAGLLQRETHNDINKLPFLGDIPILGALFRSKNFQDKQTELVVFITPNVRDATSPGNVDRIRATGERLQEDMGASPYLEQPLQPGADYAHPDALSGAVSVTPAAVAPAAVTVPAPDLRFARSREGSVLTVSTDATPLRAAPSDSAQLLRLLSRGATVVLGDAEPEGATTGHWQSVRLGDITGWVHAESVTPSRLEAANAILSRVPQGARSAPGQSAQGNSHPVTADEATPASPHTVFRVQIDDLALHATPDVNSSVVARVARGTLLTGLAQARVDGWTSVRFGSGTAVARGWADSQWLLPVEAQ
jgi:pilus assembly protein CpaC